MAAKPKKATKKVPAKKAIKVSSKARKSKPVAKRVQARPAAKPKLTANKAAAKKPAAKKPAAKKPAAKKPSTKQASQPGYHTVTPMLNISGAEDAIAFYQKAFGAQERLRMPGPDGKIAHAEIVIGDSVVMIADVGSLPPTSSALHVYVPDCDALYSRAVAAGANVRTPLQDMFWGDRFGTVTDPFGITWSIATHKEDVSPEEMEKRMAALPPPDSGAPPTASA
jgi:PhnB protein